MGSQRVEFESEAWYRAVAEGRMRPVSDLGSRSFGPRWGHDGVALVGRRPVRDERPGLLDAGRVARAARWG